MNNLKFDLILRKTETGRKNGKFLYQIIDQQGNVISDRLSNRDYVAATSNGGFFFGRLDLIGKGDHGRLINGISLLISKRNCSDTVEKWENVHKISFQDYVEERENVLNRITKIAILEAK